MSSTEDTDYIPSEEALKFIAFLRATGNEENVSPEAHYKIADVLFSSNKKDWKVIIECLRGLGKSTVVEYVFIYIAALGYWPNFGKVPFVVFLGASQDGNVKSFFKNVAGKITNSLFLSQLFKLDGKNFRQIDNEIELTNQDGVVTIAAGRGMSTNWRGIRSRTGKRPTVLIADDVLPNDVMTSETIRKTIETNWFNSALPALDPMKHKIIYIGTPLSEADLLHQLKKSGAYTILRFPLCPKFPVPEKEFKSIWPDRFTYGYAKDLFDQYKAAGTTQSFYTEFMLEITDLSTLLVEEEDIQWFDPSQLVKHKASYNFYIVTDFATSTKKSADFSTIGVVAISSNNDWLLVDGQCLRQTMQDNMDDLFRYVKKWAPLSVGIETSGQQGGFISILQEMMVARNIWFTFAKKPGSKDPGIRPVKDKVHRFVTGVQPKFKQNKVWFPKPELTAKTFPRLHTLVEEMLHELSRFTLAGGTKALAHDDACFVGSTPVAMAGGGYKSIKDVVSGDRVFNISNSLNSLTEGAILTGHKEVIDYIFSDGSTLTMTNNHPILTSSGWIAAGDITSTHKIKVIAWQENMMQSQKCTMGLNGRVENIGTTNVPPENRALKSTYTGTYIVKSMDQYLKAFISTIKITISAITHQKIWSVSRVPNTLQNTALGGTTSNNARISITSERLLTTRFTEVMKEKNFTGETSNATEKKSTGSMIKHAGGVGSLQEVNSKIKRPTVIESVNLVIFRLMGLKNTSAKYVKKAFCSIGKKPHVRKSVGVSTTGSSEMSTNTRAYCAEVVLPVTEKSVESSVLKNVGLVVEKRCMTAEDVKNVERCTNQKLAALGFVGLSVKNVQLERKVNRRIEPVYNLSAADGRNYLVGKGVIVHNCDLLNQLSEMDLYAPANSEESTSSVITADGLVWTSVWGDEDGSDDYVNSVIF